MHKAKHAAGFALEQRDDGSLTLLTPTGFRHPVPVYVQPTADGRFPDIALVEDDFQFSVTELGDALAYLRHERDRIVVSPPKLWEHDPDHPGLDPEIRDQLRRLHREAA